MLQPFLEHRLAHRCSSTPSVSQSVAAAAPSVRQCQIACTRQLTSHSKAITQSFSQQQQPTSGATMYSDTLITDSRGCWYNNWT